MYDRDGPLHLAVKQGAEDLAIALIDAGADVEARSSPTASTALHLAAAGGHAAIIPLLITPNTLDAKDWTGSTPLQLALSRNHPAAAAVLVAAGAQLLKPAQRYEDTPLTKAFLGMVHGWGPQLAGALLNRVVADPAAVSMREEAVSWIRYNQQTALHVAAERGYNELAPLLVAAGAERDAMDAAGATPLHAAVANGHLQLVPLLATPANVNLSGPSQVIPGLWAAAQKGTPLCAAARKGNEPAVKALLAAGAQVDARDSKVRSALTAAAEGGHMGVVALLLPVLVSECGAQGQARLAAQVAAAAMPLVLLSNHTADCAQLLEMVLDAAGAQVAEQVCQEVQRLLQQELEQPTPQKRLDLQTAWSEIRSSGGTVGHLPGALLAGWAQAQQRHCIQPPLVARLQRLGVAGDEASTQQQQQQQRQPVPNWQLNDQLPDLVKQAIQAAAGGQQQRALALLDKAWLLYMQEGQGSTSSAGAAVSTQCSATLSHHQLTGACLCEPPCLGRLLRWGLRRVAAPGELDTPSCSTTTADHEPAVATTQQRAASCWPPGVHTALLAAWVKARHTQRLQVAKSVVAAVAAAQGRHQLQEEAQTEQQQAGEKAVIAPAAVVVAEQEQHQQLEGQRMQQQQQQQQQEEEEAVASAAMAVAPQQQQQQQDEVGPTAVSTTVADEQAGAQEGQVVEQQQQEMVTAAAVKEATATAVHVGQQQHTQAPEAGEQHVQEAPLLAPSGAGPATAAEPQQQAPVGAVKQQQQEEVRVTPDAGVAEVQGLHPKQQAARLREQQMGARPAMQPHQQQRRRRRKGLRQQTLTAVPQSQAAVHRAWVQTGRGLLALLAALVAAAAGWCILVQLV